MELPYLKPAIEEGIARSLAELDAIANNLEAPTFENTILGMEGCGRDLKRVMTCYQIWSGSLSSPEFREVQQEIVPILSDYNSKRIQNDVLFQRFWR